MSRIIARGRLEQCRDCRAAITVAIVSWWLIGFCFVGQPVVLAQWIEPIELGESSVQRIPRQPLPQAGDLQGLVTGPSTTPIPGVAIKLRHLTTGKTFLRLTDGDGIFRVLDVPPGEYELQADKSGFVSVVQQHLRIVAGEVLTLCVQMKPATLPPARIERLPYQPLLKPESDGSLVVTEEPGSEASYVRRATDERPAEARPTPVLPLDVSEIITPVDPPIGYTGSGSRPRRGQKTDRVADRWRLGWPDWDRQTGYEAPYHRGRPYDPYNQNVLKGDYPIIGQNVFAIVTGSSETLTEARRLYIPSPPSAAEAGSEDFFGRGEMFFLRQNFELTFELFRGSTAFKPQDWVFRITPVFNINYLNTRENGVVNIDVRRGTNRLDGHVGLQELFGEIKLADSPPGLIGFFRGLFKRDKSPYFDFTSLRVGIQKFNSDFRGFIFREQNMGYRLFGNNHNNLYQWNLAYFTQLDKDTNSELNTVFQSRHQNVAVFNMYRQDFIVKGYTIQGSIHYNDDHAGHRDKGGLHFNRNNFLERPAPIGGFRPHNLNIVYLGIAGDGHIGRLNLTHAFYQALGEDDFNPIANRRVDVNAQMAAVEASVDRDWLRLKSSFFWSSGDDRPTDRRARGFDTIFDEPVFAGGEFSFWNRQGLRLTGTGVGLVQPNSLIPSLRTSKGEGQSNFVNPGLFLFNMGTDLELTPKLRSLVNVNLLWFHHTEPIEQLLYQAPIRRFIGTDYSIGVQYRPLLNNNIILKGGVAALVPGNGLKDIFNSRVLYVAFASTRFTF
ncbi:MAG: carboxypeptidase-like regulatory domain-containing protein [Acidobacteriota bacterium]|nr:carboxypeptidase-like regulatory domain-containing protein [Blastocatellia bacterium]MDW8239574.1 carboxypeptidase-like regulatory domain-containing protein [Acidobacteriota bacterium]